MDVLYSGRDASYYLTMAQLLSGELMKTASNAAAFNIKDSFIKRRFEEEIRFFIHAQLDALKRSTSDNERRGYIENIRQEISHLEKQHSQPRMKTAKLHTSIIVTKRKDTWSYVIDGVGIVLGGLQVVAGIGTIIGSIATGNIIGLAFGSVLILHGINGLQESSVNLYEGRDDTIGIVRENIYQLHNLQDLVLRLGPSLTT